MSDPISVSQVIAQQQLTPRAEPVSVTVLPRECPFCGERWSAELLGDWPQPTLRLQPCKPCLTQRTSRRVRQRQSDFTLERPRRAGGYDDVPF